MVPWRATDDGLVTCDVLDWYERFARGRPGAIVVEATGIRDVPSGPLLRIGHDRFLPGLRRLVDAAHARDVAVVLDVVCNHLGPEGNVLADFGPYFTDRYATPWGAALNFDGPDSDHVREFFIDSACSWVALAHVDGLEEHEGVGRHLLGSQIFDYWRDPWGQKHEHYADGDLFDAAQPPGYHVLDRAGLIDRG